MGRRDRGKDTITFSKEDILNFVKEEKNPVEKNKRYKRWLSELEKGNLIIKSSILKNWKLASKSKIDKEKNDHKAKEYEVLETSNLRRGVDQKVLNSIDSKVESLKLVAQSEVTFSELKELRDTTAIKNKLKDKKSEEKQEILTLAINEGDIDFVKSLREAGLSISDSKSSELLFAACQKGNLKSVKILIADGVNIDAKNQAELTAFMLAAGKDDLEIMKLLVAAGADISSSCSAQGEKAKAYLGNIKKLFELVNKEVKDLSLEEVIFRLTTIEQSPETVNLTMNGTPIVITAINKGNDRMLEVLTNHGVDVNRHDKRGLTALTIAAKKGSVLMRKVLIRAGAYFDSLDNDQVKDDDSYQKTLMEFIDLLKADPQNLSTEQKDKNEKRCLELIRSNPEMASLAFNPHSTALTLATQNNYSALVQRMLKSKKHIKLNVKDTKGMTALRFAAREDNIEIFKQLINAGAYVDLFDDKTSNINNIVRKEGKVASYLKNISDFFLYFFLR